MNRIALAALIVPLALTACGKDAAQQAGGPPGGGMAPAEVEVVTVGPKTVAQTVEVPGRMTAVRVAQVRARVEGILEKREYTEGSEVKAGQVLFRIDQRPLAANAESAKAALARARATALIAAQNLERMQALKDTKAIARQEYDQAVAAKAQGDADVAAAQAALTQAEINLSYTTVTAPISGRIGRALVTEGALVGKGEATHLATIEQYDPIWVDFSQSSAEFIQLRETMKSGRTKASRAPVKLVLETGREYAQPGKLLFNDLAVDPATGSVGQRAEFANPGRELLPGQFVTVRLPVAQAENVIAVPQKAVMTSAQGQMVMLVSPEGTVVPQPVKTGGLAGEDWLIAEGLKGGEQVIVNGLQKARPGAPVKPVSSSQPAVSSNQK
ncbi:MAG: efflux RND transporter periplasmic adaptor subunit [Thiobacillus sp.]|nr:efflux RND transporter periplasmic adaptor subunit [Thiobacillus sp.]